MVQKSRAQTQHRDSVKGTFTTPQDAARRPRETEKERIRHPATPPKRGK